MNQVEKIQYFDTKKGRTHSGKPDVLKRTMPEKVIYNARKVTFFSDFKGDKGLE